VVLKTNACNGISGKEHGTGCGIEVIGKAIFRRKYQREYCARYIITILNNVWAQFGKCLLSDQCN
jgi:hypothetical protein